MASMEIERKFLTASLPSGLLDGVDGEPIAQGYLAEEEGVEVRVRRKGSAHTLTVKGGAGRIRTEVELNLDQDQFEALWPLTEGRRLQKLRHEVPFDQVVAEVDVYQGRLEGLVVVEVEFDSADAATAFAPPSWFAAEITDDHRYGNARLARASGLPESPAQPRSSSPQDTPDSRDRS